ncbi:exocyst complex subunit Sec15-like protein [Aureobasidium subglaciale]|nr:exocyst complex subunit Sec15-like protein [Aureobasidium subglaciale]KAI5228121.1 exocyst complex subunit Sec15-like protein [Aureobasidium subglaciale]KAI5231464.1 exocyst complex subunit Sec15-like protein [Aureobasidium subglaciale]KAI5265539.1 exocyst complex subunit Sec15-like protein [Aureobasidium subglaciale]
MPAIIEPHDEFMGAVQQVIILSSSETDYIDQLIPVMRDLRNSERAGHLIQALNQVSNDRQAEIERICNTNHQEFINSVNQLQHVRQGTVDLTAEIMSLSQSIEASTEKLAEQKRALVDSRGVRQNIDDATQALKDCLEVLRLANQVHDLLQEKNRYAALRALDELQNVHLREVTRYMIAGMIERSVPATQRLIAEAVMADLNTWLFRIRETSQFLGEVAFYHTEMRRTRHKMRFEENPDLANFKLNSAVEAVADESEEFDVLNNEEVQVDFSPLFEAIHIHDALGQSEKFRQDYSATRRRQKELLLPTSLDLLDEDAGELSTLLESIAGFAIVEKATMLKTENLRSSADVDELWDSMCQSAITLVSKSLPAIDNDERLLKIKGVIALFVQTMGSWGYSVDSLDKLLLTIFDKYAQLLKQRFSEDFQEIVSTDDYMPMPINNPDEYDKVINVSWYTPEKDREQQNSFPCVLPFSQMYPLCCIDIRNFLNQIYLFSDDHFQNTGVIDDTLKSSLDDLLCHKVCQSLVERLSSQYPGQIVQILTNLDHFETACRELQDLLAEARSSSSAAGPIVLAATEEFTTAKKAAEKRIFELVNSKIDDLIETAEYDWSSTYEPSAASPYMQELTRYLSDVMSSVLLGLPVQIKELIYFDALAHISNAILALPLDPSIRRLSPQSVTAFRLDSEHLIEFVRSLDNPVLMEGLDELRQTVELMAVAKEGEGRAEEEFFDVEKGRKRFGKVDKMSGAELLEKVSQGVEAQKAAAVAQAASPVADKKSTMNFPAFASRFKKDKDAS